MSESAGWNKQHEKYAHTDWIVRPTIFGEWALQYFPSTGKVLDAGCGQGQDTKLFAEKGYTVVAADFSETALKFSEEKMPAELKPKIEYRRIDLSERLPLEDSSFEVVYSHMASHYFDAAGTQRLFDEYFRVLKPGGVLLLLLNTVHDAEIAKGIMLEKDFYQISDMKKRFFSAESVRAFASQFEVILADEEGETYKDRAIGNGKLVRLVARKA